MENKHILVYSIISLIIISPFLTNYLLLLDWTEAPTVSLIANPNSINHLPVQIIRKALSEVIPTSVIQKLIIFLIFTLSGISMHSLIKTQSSIPKYFAGLLYMINPFTYLRLMAGHWHILLAYSITPFVIASVIKLFKENNYRQTLKTSLWLTLIAIINTHTLFLLLLVTAIFFIFNLKCLKQTLYLALFFLILNSFWIYPMLTKDSSVSQITSDDLIAFQTRESFSNEFFTSLAMYGFWRQDAYIIPKYTLPFFIIILFLAIHGYRHSKYRLPILTAAIVSILLAVGISHPWSRNLSELIFNNIFFMRGFRDSNKFIAILAFAYSFFAAYGLSNLTKQKKLLTVLIITPLLYTPPTLLWQQLHTTDYPADWYEINTFLNNDKESFNVLFLPWHLYMDFSWNLNRDKRMANPASVFFDKPIIQGDNMEVYTIYSSSTNQKSKYVESMLANKTASTLQKLNIKYIIIAKEVDYKSYLWLLNETELVKETNNLYLLKYP